MPREHQETTTTVQRRNRRFPRRVVQLGAELSPINIKSNVPLNISNIQGLIKNISPAGLFVELPMLYRVGTRFQVRVPIDDRLQSFYAIVWRVSIDEDSGEKDQVYGHGMKITTASEDTMHAIVSYIANGS